LILFVVLSQVCQQIPDFSFCCGHKLNMYNLRSFLFCFQYLKNVQIKEYVSTVASWFQMPAQDDDGPRRSSRSMRIGGPE
jgi:hypothetical protein